MIERIQPVILQKELGNACSPLCLKQPETVAQNIELYNNNLISVGNKISMVTTVLTVMYLSTFMKYLFMKKKLQAIHLLFNDN